MDALANADAWIALVSLAAMEIVLGIDNILALSFLLLIGVLLTAEGLGQHVSKGYVYFAMGFSLFVELLNIRRTKVAQPIQLHSRFEQPPSGA